MRLATPDGVVRSCALEGGVATPLFHKDLSALEGRCGRGVKEVS